MQLQSSFICCFHHVHVCVPLCPTPQLPAETHNAVDGRNILLLINVSEPLQARKAQAKRMSADALGDDNDIADALDGARIGGYRGRRQRAQRAQQPAEHGPSGKASFMAPTVTIIKGVRISCWCQIVFSFA